MTADLTVPTRVHAQRGARAPLTRFVAVRTVRTALVWAVVIGLYVWLSATGYVTLAPTPAARQAILGTLSTNPGLKALLGDTSQLRDVAGFVDWRALGVVTLALAVWGLLTATRILRGEESAGRWELFLAGRTTARRATLSALAGLGAGVLVLFVVDTAVTALAGTRSDLGFSPARSALLGLAVASSAAMFMAVGALTSQLMPTRARAASAAAGVFGVAFVLRALGDAAPSVHWLVYLSPLGWLEQLHPLAHPEPLWLLPIVAWVVVLAGFSVVLAHRDLGASTLPDRDTAAPRLGLLGSSIGLTLRLTRVGLLSWLLAVTVAAVVYGSIAKSAGRAFASSARMRQFTGGLTGSATQLGTQTYAGIVFLLLMTLVMAYVASAVSATREQEADGYLDNLLVREVSRVRWLAGRLGLVLAVTLSAGVLAGVGFWLGGAGQHTGLALGTLVQAGLNAMAPPVLLLGLTVAVFGFVPRWTALAGYGLLAYSFLLEMLGSAVHINHWVMDTSLLHHISLAPAVAPHWSPVLVYVGISAVLVAAGVWRFDRRDVKLD